MTPQVKAFITQLRDLRSIPGAHMKVEDENGLCEAVLDLYTCAMARKHPHSLAERDEENK